MKGKLFSPGKLLLTSEYAVLDGALALAVPTKLGQEFFFQEINDSQSTVFWEAFHQDTPWLSIEINYRNWSIVQTNNFKSAAFVVKILKQIQDLSKTVLKENSSYRITTQLQFPSDFGWGSSSTLINNLASWAAIDAYQLNEFSFGGSGYDIAVAKEKSAVLYRNYDQQITAEKINFEPGFRNELIFIHLNQKQNSREGIQLYRSKDKSNTLIKELSQITEQVAACSDLENFSQLMNLHEDLLSNFLGIQKIKEKYFENCPFFVKSLGAWGGDFVMSRKFSGFESYFQEKGFLTIFGWEEIIA